MCQLGGVRCPLYPRRNSRTVSGQAVFGLFPRTQPELDLCNLLGTASKDDYYYFRWNVLYNL